MIDRSWILPTWKTAYTRPPFFFLLNIRRVTARQMRFPEETTFRSGSPQRFTMNYLYLILANFNKSFQYDRRSFVAGF
ncbi:hypothetical protein BD770DRAFT_391009 [Pilaira anomala]|nr:hypothetical protein BD770DRAFT_391009 [Pilaira anomala]